MTQNAAYQAIFCTLKTTSGFINLFRLCDATLQLSDELHVKSTGLYTGKQTSSVTTARGWNADHARNYGPRFTRWRSSRKQVHVLPMTDETNAGKSIISKYSRYIHA